MEQQPSSASEQGRESRVDSTASFMSMERASGAVEPNGAYAPGSPSKLSAELARRLAVADSNPPQPQVRGPCRAGVRCVVLGAQRGMPPALQASLKAQGLACRAAAAADACIVLGTHRRRWINVPSEHGMRTLRQLLLHACRRPC